MVVRSVVESTVVESVVVLSVTVEVVSVTVVNGDVDVVAGEGSHFPFINSSVTVAFAQVSKAVGHWVVVPVPSQLHTKKADASISELTNWLAQSAHPATCMTQALDR